MKKLYWKIRSAYISAKAEDIYVGIIAQELCYIDEEEAKSFTETVRDWELACHLTYCYYDETIFKHKPLLKCAFFSPAKKIFKDEYRCHTYNTVFQECDLNWSLSEYASTLSLADFLEFCKDNGLYMCLAKE